MPLFGPPNVAKMQARRDVPGLVKALNYKTESAIRQQAAAALGQIGAAEAVDALIAALKDGKVQVREASAEALGQIGDPRAVRPLVDLLSGSRGLSEAAATALATGPPAVPSLIAKIQASGEPVASQAALDALRQMGWEPADDASGAAYWAAVGDWKKCAQIGAAAVEPLAAKLRGAWYPASCQIVEALGQIGDPQAVKPLIEALKSKHGSLRKTAAKALGQIGDPRAVELLIAALKDEDGAVGMAAAEALGQIGDPKAVEPLIETLSDSTMCTTSAKALVKIGPPAVDPLAAALDRKSLRQAAAATLKELGWQPDETEAGAHYWAVHGDWRRCAQLGQVAVEPLVAALQEGYGGERDGAAKALVRIGGPRATKLLAAALRDREACRAAAQALEQLGWQPDETEAGAQYWIIKRQWGKCARLGQVAVKPLLTALKEEDQGVRRGAAAALVSIGDPRAVKPLMAAFRTWLGQMSEDGANALAGIGTPAVEPLIAVLGTRDGPDAEKILVQIGAPAIDRLVAALDRLDKRTPAVRRVLEQLATDQDANVRGKVARALGESGGSPLVGSLIAALKDKEERVREDAALALAQIGKPAVKPLIAALRDEEGSVREDAATALGLIGTPAVQPLITALEDPHPRVRKSVAFALEQIGTPAVEPLFSAVWDRPEMLDGAAAGTLAGIVGAFSVEPLIYRLKDRDLTVRRRAAELLVTLYKIGKLDDEQKSRILSVRYVIISRPGWHRPPGHSDGHFDTDKCSFHGDSGGQQHDDVGAGVDFRL